MLPNALVKPEIPYAFVKMDESARIIRQSINELPTLRRRLEKNRDIKPRAREIYGDLQNQFRRLLGGLDNATLSLLEAEHDDLANHTVKLGQSIKSFNLLTPDYSKLCDVLTNYLTGLPLPDQNEGSIFDILSEGDTDEDAQTTNNRIIGRLMNNVRMGYYPTCTDNLAHIVRGIDCPVGLTVNLLDPCCGCGLALRFMAERISDNGNDCKTYGIELDTHRAEEALTRIDRVGFGSFYRSRISNEAFHAMLLNPPYLSVMTEGGSNARNEKGFLVDSVRNLLIGGLLIYIIPHYRLTADIARLLCDNFSDISVWKFTSNEFKKFKQIAVLGTRQKRKDGSDLATELSSSVLNPAMLPELSELPAGRYPLPNTAKDVALFKGAEFNVVELSEQLSKSKSFLRLFQRSQLDNTSKRPLLPLSIGQIGLVGGSGLINGWVDCETPHIIKGRIVKEKRLRTDENTNSRGHLISTTLTETVSNKLIFNLLTPNGFISLTDYSGIGTITDSDNDPSDDSHSRLGHSVSGGTLDATATEIANKNPRFSMGRVVITCGAREVLTDSDVNTALLRHQSGDWGEVSVSDKAENEKALKHGNRILSSYRSSDNEMFWIITEWDRSVTTVLMPSEY